MTALTLSPQEARRLAVVAQQLEAPRPNPTKADILDMIRRITCVQIDPINTVARTQLLVLFSRLGLYNPADLETLLWDDKELFEYWAHAASIVLADDFPIFQPQMIHRQPSGGLWWQRTYSWVDANESLRQHIIDEIAARGPLFAGEIEDKAMVDWVPGRWSSGGNVKTMLEVMWGRGEVTVTRRLGDGFGLKKQWGLMEHQLGGRVHEPPLDQPTMVRRAAKRALLALGPARLRDIRQYFTRGVYPGLAHTLRELESEGVIRRVAIRDDEGDWPGPWFLHNDLLAELERIRRGDWQSQTVLLSPFDNLIADRDRTELLFDFFYRIEIYTPAAKRQYGYYVMPILHGDRIIGRIDPKMDRKTGRLIINAIHLEPGVVAPEVRPAIDGAIESLAAFLGASAIDYPNGRL